MNYSSHHRGSDFRFARISDHASFQKLLSSAGKCDFGKDPPKRAPKTQNRSQSFSLVKGASFDSEKSLKSAVADVFKERTEYIDVGGTFFITSDWDLFREHYFAKLVVTSEVIVHYLGKRVEVTHIDDDLVRVQFKDIDLEDGWIPYQVLKSSRPKSSSSLELVKSKKGADAEKPISKELQKKIDNLAMANKKLKQSNKDIRDELSGKSREIADLESEIHSLKEENHVILEEQAQLREQLDEGLDQAHTSMLKLEQMEKTHVKKTIDNVGVLFEMGTLSELFEANRVLQQYIEQATSRLQEQKREAEIAKSRAEDQHLCVVCLVEPKTYSFRPCGHFCVCETCAVKLHSDKKPCPTCRRHIHTIERTFAV